MKKLSRQRWWWRVSVSASCQPDDGMMTDHDGTGHRDYLCMRKTSPPQSLTLYVIWLCSWQLSSTFWGSVKRKRKKCMYILMFYLFNLIRIYQSFVKMFSKLCSTLFNYAKVSVKCTNCIQLPSHHLYSGKMLLCAYVYVCERLFVILISQFSFLLHFCDIIRSIIYVIRIITCKTPIVLHPG